MNRLTLSYPFVKHLTELPETGMGYHTVDVLLSTNQVLYEQIVLNCEELITEIPVREEEILEIRLSEV